MSFTCLADVAVSWLMAAGMMLSLGNVLPLDESEPVNRTGEARESASASRVRRSAETTD